MTQVDKTLKEGIFKNKPYTLKILEAPIKLNQNESPFDLPQDLKNKILQTVQNMPWNIYPDFVPEKLYEKVGKHYNVSGKQILLGNGSNEMINTILSATVERGTHVIVPTPTFTVYALIAGNLNGTVREVLSNPDLSFNIDKIIEESKTPGSITIVCTPNNPTGLTVTRKDIIRIIEASKGIVVVDEAYIQFGGESVIDLIDTYEHLIILRTLSKAVGLAGLRLGIMISNPYLIEQMSKVKLPYNLDVFSLTTFDIVYESMHLFEETAKYLNKQREFVFNSLKSIDNIKFTPSDANFFIIKTNDADKIFNSLHKKGILVRNVSSYPLLENCLRITIGNEEQNLAIIQALKEIYNVENKI